jgi:poly(3-hydroxybutyrate) depolymerase
LYAPPTLAPEGPVQLVVALHGIGDNGPNIAQPFISLARDHGWLLAAPTMAYGDWFDPVRVRSDDLVFCRQLEALLADVPLRTGREVLGPVFLIGFSRGAQLADRFAFFHPDEVAGVASMSAGTYTMPENTADMNGDGRPDPLPLPFGTADMQRVFGHGLDMDELRRVPFWISVGGADDNPNDLPRQWDALQGRTRITRASAFAQLLATLHVPVQLQVFPGATHQLTPAMAGGVGSFLSRLGA